MSNNDIDRSRTKLVRRKRAIKSERIVSRLRQEIVAGALQLGSRLPVRTEMERLFDVSTTTVQRALDQLAAEGFVVAQGKRGTFVTTEQPFRKRYGLVIRAPARGNQYGAVLLQEALQWKRKTGFELSIYEDVGPHTDTDSYQRLAADLQAHRLAGVIVEVPWALSDTPLAGVCQAARVPLVGLGDRPTTPDMLIIRTDAGQLRARVLDRFAALGRRSIAVLADALSPADARELEQDIRRRGLSTRPYWLQAVSPNCARSARAVMHLLMQAQERPDALWITDDALVEPATAGLNDAGTQVPAHLEVIAHCNFPYPTPSHLAIRRAGFSVPQVIAAALDLIDRRRRGETVPPITAIPAVFDDEPAASESPERALAATSSTAVTGE